MNSEIVDPIAERTLMRDNGATVTVKLAQPRPFEEAAPEGDWYCAYRVDGVGDEPVASFAAGVDGIQALILALAKVGDYLTSRDDLGLSFHGRGYLGFLSAKLPPISDEMG
jgi:hypothetical protein